MRAVAIALIVCLAVPAWTASYSLQAPNIGVLTQPSAGSACETLAAGDVSGAQSTFAAVYVKWLEAAGARVVPIRYNLPFDELYALWESLDGVLFTGGATPIAPGYPYFDTAWHLFNWTLGYNHEGGTMPLWGTCEGFQLLSILAANDTDVLTCCFDSENLSLALDFVPGAKSNPLFSGPAGEEAYALFATLNITTNLHHSGVVPKEYAGGTRLGDFFDVLSTNEGRDGKEFVSLSVAYDVPVFQSQFHPERVFEFNRPTDPLNINHSPEAIVANEYLGRVFVDTARQCAHEFPTFEDQQEALIYNYAPTPTGSSYYCYFFE